MPIVCPDSSGPDSGPDCALFEQFPYELSPFQKHAIHHIVGGNHVLVCAPTGSGKTLPAEFAIRHFVGQGKKVVYTSPIKALSNQKFYEFSQKFPEISVGLCTGDIKTNPTADLMIMTAEILNNALINHRSNKHNNNNHNQNVSGDLHFQIDIDTELAAIVMDEVHYINDDSRGHVWEQSIMFCPPHVQLVMLSATLDGPEKFAEWIESTNPGRRVALTQTHRRIVPLTHYAFIPSLDSTPKLIKDKAVVQQLNQTTNRLLCIQSATGVFNDETYHSIGNSLKIYDKHDIRVSPKHTLNQLAKFMKGQEDPDVDDCMLPAIVFVLSRKQVEKYADDITASMWPFDAKAPYTVARECEQILRKLPNWREYASLPEYATLVKNLEKGVATHHSGMIPVFREIVEILVSKKMVRLLFATESFAIGLDCPIRTAVFTGLSKFDGTGDRFFHSHEYTQMAGRAGRRGIDTIGNAIHVPSLYRTMPTMKEMRSILSGTPQKLVSKFHIDYSMILKTVVTATNTDANTIDIEKKAFQFAEKSMIRDEIAKHWEADKKAEQEAKEKYDAKCTAVETSLRTPLDICQKYVGLKKTIPYLVNKKRKEAERTLGQLEQEWKWIKDDAIRTEERDALSYAWAKARQTVQDTEQWLKTQTQLVIRVLLDDGFLIKHDDDNNSDDTKQITTLGWVASQITEIHPLVIAKCIFLWDNMERFSAIQLVGWLASFCDARLPEEQRATEPTTRDEYLLYRLKEMLKMYHRYNDMEREFRMNTGIEYSSALCFDMTDLMMEWAQLEDERTCRAFIQNEIPVSVGDFVKAILKISALSKELRALALNAGFVRFADQLEKIDPLILKYVATTQSLYL